MRRGFCLAFILNGPKTVTCIQIWKLFWLLHCLALKKTPFLLYINDTKMEKMVPFFCNLYHVKKTLFTIKIFKVYLGSFVQKKKK